MPSSIKFIIPQIVTFTNLSLGVIAIISTNLSLSAIFIIIAAIIDRLDGKIARKLNVESDLGKELDSLSDLISFGAAPAVIAWKIGIGTLSAFWGYIPLLIYVMAGAFRLARYNVSNFSGSFVGMPITIAGFIVAVAALFKPDGMILAALLLVLSVLMISTIKLKKI